MFKQALEKTNRNQIYFHILLRPNNVYSFCYITFELLAEHPYLYICILWKCLAQPKKSKKNCFLLSLLLNTKKLEFLLPSITLQRIETFWRKGWWYLISYGMNYISRAEANLLRKRERNQILLYVTHIPTKSTPFQVGGMLLNNLYEPIWRSKK